MSATRPTVAVFEEWDMIKVGDTLPKATFTVMGEGGPATKTTDDIFKGKKVVLFGLPGAYTPTCSGNHLPGYLNKVAEIKAKGVDTIAVVSVNDVFVMDAWARSSGGKGKIEFLADGSAAFAKAIGLEVDLTERGMGVRSQRYSMLVEDGVVRRLNIEEAPGKADLSGADAMLGQL
jgi:glutaredoxin/glutathione-dependent peroxiredoxin